MEASSASADVQGFGAALVIPSGFRYVSRSGKDGYSRIAVATPVLAEGSDPMLSQFSFGSITSFLPTTPLVMPMPLSIVGGRTLTIDIIVRINGAVMDITDCSFSAQIRQSRDNTNLMGEFNYEILDAENGSVRLSLSPDETQWLASNMSSGVWDMIVITSGGDVLPVIPESPVNARQGVSRYTDEILFDYGKDRVKPIKKNYLYFVGDTWVRTLVFRTANGIAINKTGCSYQMQLRRQKDSPTVDMYATFDMSQDDKGIIIGTMNTSAALPGRYYFDIEETDENNNVSTIVYGTFNFIQDVTRG